MPRAAGSNSTYDFVLRRGDTGRYVPSVSIRLPSVTSIIGKVLAKPALVPWTYRETRDRISGLVSTLMDGSPSVDGAYEVLDLLSDSDMLEEYLKENKLRPEDTTKEASDRGTQGHKLLERLGAAAQGEATGDEDAAQIAEKGIASKHSSVFDKAIAQWWLDVRPQVLASEAIVVSLKHGFVGTVDLVWRDTEGRTIVTDLKTREKGKGVYESDFIQTTGYAIAFAEMTGLSVSACTVLIAQDDGTCIHEINPYPISVFLSLLDVYGELEKGGK